MYKSLYNTISYISENYLIESQESKSIDAAKKLYMQTQSVSKEDADKFIRDTLRSKLDALREKDLAKFILGCTRMYLNNELNNVDNVIFLNKILREIKNNNEIDKFDRNLNNLSFDELYDKYHTLIISKSNVSKDKLNSIKFEKNNNYQIYKINSFDDAARFAKYTTWCVCQSNTAYESYALNKNAIFYFCVRNDFKEVVKEKGTNYPLDSYGLSMFAVTVDADGELLTCTCRWNQGGTNNDHIMNEKQISYVIGQNFYDIFKPDSNQQKNKEEIQNNIKKDIEYIEDELVDKINEFIEEKRDQPGGITSSLDKDILKKFNNFIFKKETDNYYFIFKKQSGKADKIYWYNRRINKAIYLINNNISWMSYSYYCYYSYNNNLIITHNNSGVTIFKIEGLNISKVFEASMLIPKQWRFFNRNLIFLPQNGQNMSYGIINLDTFKYKELQDLTKILSKYNYGELLFGEIDEKKDVNERTILFIKTADKNTIELPAEIREYLNPNGAII